MKKAISLLVVLSMVLMSLGSITLVGSAETGATIEYNGVTYETISSTEEFVSKLNANTTDGVTTGNYAILTDNIILDQTLTEGAYEPFATFSGTLIGMNADGTVEELRTVNIKADLSGNVTGMFNTISGATIKNIKTTGTMTTSDSGNSGAFAASNTTSESSFINCENSVVMTIVRNSSSYAGGFVGYSDIALKFENCKNTGNITATGTPGTFYVGGLIGRQNGGILSITYCANSASISGGSKTGGLIGGTTRVEIISSANTGNITGYGDVGGLVGGLVSKKIYTIEKSYNTGSIHCSNSRGGTTATYVGGLAGYAPETTTSDIKNSYSSGGLTYTDKSTHTTTVSGLLTIGTTGTFNIENCYTAVKETFITNTSATLNMTNCYYLADETGTESNGLRALSESDMKIKDNFIGFDWTIWNEPVNSYPTLK